MAGARSTEADMQAGCKSLVHGSSLRLPTAFFPQSTIECSVYVLVGGV